MRRLIMALQAFWKALSDPEGAKLFLRRGQKVIKPAEEKEEDASHLRLLALMQHSGRLLDFFKEDIAAFSDAQVGAAVRQVHSCCQETLEELVTIRPILDSTEGNTISINSGYDAAAIRLVGNVPEKAPYVGIVVHPGWKAHKLSLPKQARGTGGGVILSPAEVEVR